MPRVSILSTGEQFTVGDDEDVLRAALHNGLNLRYGCRHGNCSSCKHWLIEGEVDDSSASVYAIPESERDRGAILLCCSYAKSDIVIDINNDGAIEEEPPPIVVPARHSGTVAALRSLTRSLVELRVRVDSPVEFLAGQYAELVLPTTGERRSFSLVNTPAAACDLVFCVRHRPGGAFARELEVLEVGSSIQLEAPFGRMCLRSHQPILAIAIGSGIAPILSILTHAASNSFTAPIRFYYGARTVSEIAYLPELLVLSERLQDFKFIPCLTRELPEAFPGARAGRVTQVIMREVKDPTGFDAYICGPPDMCEVVGDLLAAKGLPDNRIHADRFYPAVS
jgi:ferredoxin-NADP reductase/ferredoxin